ncbi:MAG: hypothetical protein MJE68_05355 [Proteobacteria bacterium]|nr:hypothetical protein [Pseudomonadota bacterium]
MVLPGRIPGYKSSDIQLLPSSTTKNRVWELYQEAAGVQSMRPVGYSTFTRLWRELLPHVVVMKPMSDFVLALSTQQHCNHKKCKPSRREEHG